MIVLALAIAGLTGCYDSDGPPIKTVWTVTDGEGGTTTVTSPVVTLTAD
jgi:hypothetical protein